MPSKERVAWRLLRDLVVLVLVHDLFDVGKIRAIHEEPSGVDVDLLLVLVGDLEDVVLVGAEDAGHNALTAAVATAAKFAVLAREVFLCVSK